jgi:predicted DCC family thiol-disulfide oxidoreductase YuxK
VLARSTAVLHTLGELGGIWRALARVGHLVPRPLADLVYRAVARQRYRIFGRFDRCQIPPPEWRERFLDQ